MLPNSWVLDFLNKLSLLPFDRSIDLLLWFFLTIADDEPFAGDSGVDYGYYNPFTFSSFSSTI
jgi:hypothetical protein